MVNIRMEIVSSRTVNDSRQKKLVYRVTRFSHSILYMRSLSILQLLKKIVPEISFQLQEFYLSLPINSSHFSMNFGKFFILRVRKSCKHRLLSMMTNDAAPLLHIQALISLQTTEMPLMHLSIVIKISFFTLIARQILCDFRNSMPIVRLYFQRKSK